MSRSEDYLDNLLTSVTDTLNEFDNDFEQNRESLKESYQTQNDLPSKTQSALDEIREENFLREFEDEINRGKTDDDFLAEFERELNGESGSELNHAADRDGTDSFSVPEDNPDLPDADLEDFFKEDAADSGMDAFQQQEDDFMQDSATMAMPQEEPATVAFDQEPQTVSMEPDMGEDVFSQMANEQDKSMEAPKGMEGLEDIFGDFGDADTILQELEEGITQPSDDSTAMAESQPDVDDSLTEILNGSDEEALSEIDKLLDADGDDDSTQKMDAQDDPLPMGPDFSFDESSLDGEDASDQKKKERNKNGLFGKISRMLFGTPAELDPEAAAEYEAAKAAMGQKEEQDQKALKEKKKQEKELKKQQKKEAAEQKKQEKEAAKAEKAAKKAAKPKKEKKPKQKNKMPKEPPLPKVPVAMMWILALSLLVLVFLGTSFVGYAVPVKESREAFENGDYVTAYRKLQGIKIRKNDKELMHAASTLAGVQTEMEAYTALMEQKQYEMALDCLVRGYNRCNLHSADAEEWNVADEMTDMQEKFDLLLKEQFDVSKHKAKKLYKIKKRSEYTLELQKILDNLGLEY
ncbi:hypothetical protein C823_002986 [Eubacterium plexicaudatum ASF492]|uniref:Uncharacterized protein n=1 Tax=Eubacterium plexicaudatum ASF492 TaxID=1235802 RepID=N2AH16_9FIRM|nr:hypothetical protein C823_002986 [Eubacterium plexicaudatum ASF492]